MLICGWQQPHEGDSKTSFLWFLASQVRSIVLLCNFSIIELTRTKSSHRLTSRFVLWTRYAVNNAFCEFAAFRAACTRGHHQLQNHVSDHHVNTRICVYLFLCTRRAQLTSISSPQLVLICCISVTCSRCLDFYPIPIARRPTTHRFLIIRSV